MAVSGQFLQLINGAPLPPPPGTSDTQAQVLPTLCNHRRIFGAVFYFRSGLLTQFISVNQLTKCFAAAVLGMILDAAVRISLGFSCTPSSFRGFAEH